MNFTVPLSTACLAFCAKLMPLNSLSGSGCTLPSGVALMATNHWLVSMGSITEPVRSPLGVISVCGLVSANKPCASRSVSICLRAAKRSRPA